MWKLARVWLSARIERERAEAALANVASRLREAELGLVGAQLLEGQCRAAAALWSMSSDQRPLARFMVSRVERAMGFQAAAGSPSIFRPADGP